jgi:FG-GAP-like repeat/FG-GAP repeat
VEWANAIIGHLATSAEVDGHDLGSGEFNIFNGDGKVDLAAIYNGSVSIYPGNGDGTFQAGTTVPGTTNAGSLSALAAADFNGDGILDLAVLSGGSGGQTIVLLGNGDGTFRQAPGSPFSVGSWTSRIYVGDFNGDGVPDLLIGATAAGRLPQLCMSIGRVRIELQSLPCSADHFGSYFRRRHAHKSPTQSVIGSRQPDISRRKSWVFVDRFLKVGNTPLDVSFGVVRRQPPSAARNCSGSSLDRGNVIASRSLGVTRLDPATISAPW